MPTQYANEAFPDYNQNDVTGEMEYVRLGVAKNLKQIKRKNSNQKFNEYLYLNVHAVPKSETDSSNNQSFFF